MNNKYKQSILHNEIEDFLLGKGKYFVMDRDRGEHDSTDTYSEILEYYLLEGKVNRNELYRFKTFFKIFY